MDRTSAAGYMKLFCQSQLGNLLKTIAFDARVTVSGVSDKKRGKILSIAKAVFVRWHSYDVSIQSKSIRLCVISLKFGSEAKLLKGISLRLGCLHLQLNLD
jgi:hypothetical protein